MIAFLWEFTKVYLAMTCLVRFKKRHSGGACGYNCPKSSIEPPGGLFYFKHIFRGGLNMGYTVILRNDAITVSPP